MVNFLKKSWVQFLIMLSLVVGLTACRPAEPPLEFTPEGAIIQKAITLQLEQTEQRLSEQLKVPSPQFEISNIQVKNNVPVFIENLAAYHLSGTYRLKLKLLHRDVLQDKNPFDIYLQRQAEGKTWRLLSKTIPNSTAQPQWSSYLIELDEPILTREPEVQQPSPATTIDDETI